MNRFGGTGEHRMKRTLPSVQMHRHGVVVTKVSGTGRALSRAIGDKGLYATIAKDVAAQFECCVAEVDVADGAYTHSLQNMLAYLL